MKLCIWSSAQYVEYWELFAEGCTATAGVYIEQLKNLEADLENARPQQHGVYFQLDNARTNIARPRLK
ncbi:hypothetical protein RB195_014622 [Necator americanus]|uniref:Uncharacterized protein n=1 Tax=Necator americanus TaxID=51031 RepID=A0ABR1E1E3_NECAM